MENLKQILAIVQIALAVLLTAAVLLQQRGVGLSATFGGEGNIYRTKRGLEKALFVATIVISILFFGAAFASFLAAR